MTTPSETLQPYVLSDYPGEYALVKIHPTNGGEQWYKRPEVDARVSQLERELNEARSVLTALLVGQEFDGGGHLTKRVAPSHSSIIKAKMLLEKEDGK